MTEQMFKVHSWSSTEWWSILIFVVIIATNQWLQIPDEQLKWIGYATGSYVGVRQGLKALMK
jgi:hypothetical protein